MSVRASAWGIKSVAGLVLVGILALACNSDRESQAAGVDAAGGDTGVGGAAGQETTDIPAPGTGGCVSPSTTSLGGAPTADQVVSVRCGETNDCPVSASGEPEWCPWSSWELALPSTFRVTTGANDLICGDGTSPAQLTEAESNTIIEIVTSPEFSIAQANYCSCTRVESERDGVSWQVSVELTGGRSIGAYCSSPTVQGDQHPTVKLRNAFMALQEKYCTVDE